METSTGEQHTNAIDLALRCCIVMGITDLYPSRGMNVEHARTAFTTQLKKLVPTASTAQSVEFTIFFFFFCRINKYQSNSQIIYFLVEIEFWRSFQSLSIGSTSQPIELTLTFWYYGMLQRK